MMLSIAACCETSKAARGRNAANGRPRYSSQNSGVDSTRSNITHRTMTVDSSVRTSYPSLVTRTVAGAHSRAAIRLNMRRYAHAAAIGAATAPAANPTLAATACTDAQIAAPARRIKGIPQRTSLIWRRKPRLNARVTSPGLSRYSTVNSTERC
ncbi:hypothetical protein Raf01_06590 [Rugosimonospora africana]|uniref:Uncharacterized protein n=1 Tax=Rugosimonospora africana TaxID=556532 RepID=A0A8J3QN09_9ACTN|nr:hypothetical protein Raf01_06590 [Rugosimonospora africana]